MRDIKLQNVLLDPGDFTENGRDLFWRIEEGKCAYDEPTHALHVLGVVDFTTYVNAISLVKWQKYTVINGAALRLTVSGGRCVVRTVSLVEGAEGPLVSEEPLMTLDGEGLVSAEAPIVGAPGAQIVGFRIECAQEVLVHTADYVAHVADSDVRTVRLALSTTTFRKEHYITRNIELVKEQLLSGPDSLADWFHMFVIDNGRTLDAEALSDDGVSVLPNPNVGGSGGFARGMMEAEEWGATHVILMDDDVRVLPESLRRSYVLLTLVNDAYADAFISGAMLNLEQPNKFFEDVARVRRDGIYIKIKPNFDIDDPMQALACECMDVEVPRAYGAWWFCCIPLKAIRTNGLPLPVFVRCDDVEFGERNNPTIMCMNGICVWHEQFEGRFRPSVDCYQYYRNFLIMDAVRQLGVRRVTLMRFERTFHIFLRAMAYETCDLMLDGLEDFLKGPDWLMEADGEAIMKAKGAKNEVLVPIAELSEEDQALAAAAPPDLSYMGIERNRHIPMKLIEQLPHDRHLLPDNLLSDAPGPVYYSRGAYPARLTMRKKILVAYDMKGERAHVRRMDRERWKELSDRYARVMKEMKQSGETVAQAYRDALPTMTSHEFWKDYLAKRM